MKLWGAIQRGSLYSACLCSVFMLGTGQAHAQNDGETTQHSISIDSPVDPLTQGAILLQADELTYNSETKVVEANGNVEVTTEERILTSETLIYYELEDKVIAKGNVVITEVTGEVYHAQEVELTNQMRDGVLTAIEAVLLENARIAGNTLYRRDGKVHEASKAVYSACDVCNDKGEQKTPLWQLKAFRVIQDKDKLRVTYRDVFFEVFGVPVFYSPYFSHADPSVKRKSGFLWPSIGNSDLTGTSLETPYYWAISDYYDLTVSPRFMTEGEVLVRGQWRHNVPSGNYELIAGFINAKDRDDNNIQTGDRKLKAHLFGKGRFKLNRNWRYGFDLQLVNDDTYLRRYGINNDIDLETKLFTTGIWNRHFLDISGYYFQGLRARDDPDKIPLVLPSVNARYVWEPGKWGRVNFDASAVSLTRSEGGDSHRISLGADWERRLTTPLGHVITPFASMRSDFYQTDNLNPNSLPNLPEDSSTISRILPTAGVDLRWPFVRPNKNSHFIVEPIVQVITSSTEENDLDIPNEDSQSFEFDTTNVFTANRFPGYDRWENGSRVNVGLRLGTYWNEGGHINATFGRTYRLTDRNNPFDLDSGLGTKKSDYVGSIEIAPIDNLRINHQIRLDSDTGKIRRNEVLLNALIGPVSGNVRYINSKKLEDTLLAQRLNREELTLSGSIKINDEWSIFAREQRDLRNDRRLRSGFGLRYEDECTLITLQINQNEFVDRDIQPEQSFLFNIILKTLN